MTSSDSPSSSEGGSLQHQNQSSSYRFQKERWQYRHFPFYAELEAQANRLFSEIKAGLAHSIILNEPNTGFFIWTGELAKYIELYGMRFSKEDHVNLIKLYLPFIQKGCYWKSTRNCIMILKILLGNHSPLRREDLIIDWKPLYELYYELHYKTVDGKGYIHPPLELKAELSVLISHARQHFSDSATRELLDKMRPLMCIWDDSSAQAWEVLSLFLPMNMNYDVHETQGCKLYFEEACHWYEIPDKDMRIEACILTIFRRLAYNCPNLLDWTPMLDIIFTKLLRTLFMKSVCVGVPDLPNTISDISCMIVYLLGSKCHDQLMKRIKSILPEFENLLHPSHAGAHSRDLFIFLNQVSKGVVARIKRERKENSNKPNNYNTNKVPDEMRLTQKHLNELVEMFIPTLNLMIFTKIHHEAVEPTIQSFAKLAPKIVIPMVLKAVNSSLESETEPHRLEQSLSVLPSMITLVRDEPDDFKMSVMIESLAILNQLLPEIDMNDVDKSIAILKLADSLLTILIIVDCSDAVHLRNDLSEVEKEFCSATSNFEFIITTLIDKILEIIANTTSAHTHAEVSYRDVIDRETCRLNDFIDGVFSSIRLNTGSVLFELVASRVYDFVSDNSFDGKNSTETVAQIVFLVALSSPDKYFPRFMDLVLERLQALLTPEVYNEEEVDYHVIWWLTIARNLIRMQNSDILANWDRIERLLELTSPMIKCAKAAKMAYSIVRCILTRLTLISVVTPNKKAIFDQPLEEFLPIRHWTTDVDRDGYKPIWNIPTKESVEKATKIFKRYIIPHIDALRSPEGRNKKEIYCHLSAIFESVDGAAFALPMLEGSNLSFDKSSVNHWREQTIAHSSDMPQISLDGKNVRQEIFDCIMQLMDYLLKSTPDDHDSINMAIILVKHVIYFRGVDMGRLKSSANDYSQHKLLFINEVSNNLKDFDILYEESIELHMQKLIAPPSYYFFKQQHIDFIGKLIEFSTSDYANNRIVAQLILNQTMILHSFWRYDQTVIDKILGYLDPSSNSTHEQQKGALYILLEGLTLSIACRVGYELQRKIWTAIIRMKSSDKMSIINLQNLAQRLVQLSDTRQLRVFIPDPVRITAEDLLKPKDGSPVNVIRSYPSKEEIEQNRNNMEEDYQKFKDNYYKLINQMITLSEDSSLHWRHRELANTMLTSLLRKDEPYPDEAIKLFTRQLVHDVESMRERAQRMLGTWMRINKLKVVKKEFNPPLQNSNNNGPGSNWPIKYGIREDNRFLLYEDDKLPKTDEEWNEHQLFSKMYIGFYTWPEKTEVVAPLGEQVNTLRTIEVLTPIERYVLETITNPEFFTKMNRYFAMDEANKPYMITKFQFYRRLFRFFGPVLLSPVKNQIETLLQSKKEEDEKLASTMITGMVIGSKYCRWEVQKEIWKWFTPIFTRIFENINENNFPTWEIFVALTSDDLPPELLKPFVDLLFELLDKSIENPFAANARFSLIQRSIMPFSWRGLGLNRKIFDILKKNPISQYSNQRQSMIEILAGISKQDVQTIYVSENLPDPLKPIRMTEVIALYDGMLSECWNELRLENFNEGRISELSSNESNSSDSESKKKSRLALKTLASYITWAAIQSHITFNPNILRLAPLFCHYSNDFGDEELMSECGKVLLIFPSMFIGRENSASIVSLFKMLLTSSCYWRTKTMVLQTIQIVMLTNHFVFKYHHDEITEIMIPLLSNPQIELRKSSAHVLSALIQIAFIQITPKLIETFVEFTKSESILERHGGILGLSAIVQAYPYTVPKFLPDILMHICKFASAPSPIKETVKTILADFKKTHLDSWREHQEQFTGEQLEILRDLLISPTYYV